MKVVPNDNFKFGGERVNIKQFHLGQNMYFTICNFDDVIVFDADGTILTLDCTRITLLNTL